MDITFDARWIPGLIALLTSIPHLFVGAMLMHAGDKRNRTNKPAAGFFVGGVGMLLATALYFIVGIVGVCNAANSIYRW